PLLRLVALPRRHGHRRDPGTARPRLDRHHDGLRTRAPRSRRRLLDQGRQMLRDATGKGQAVKWNLRLAAAKRDIWKASDMRQLLAEHGLVISVGKMSNLWSGQPTSIRLDDLEVICAVLGCGPEELMIP